jgi:DNA-binding XRE family transcriptional regulator
MYMEMKVASPRSQIWNRSRREIVEMGAAGRALATQDQLGVTMITSAQCRAARALVDWSRERLANAAAVDLQTVVDFEHDASDTRAAIKNAIQTALERAGVEFIDDGKPGVRIKAASLPIPADQFNRMQ